MSPAKRFGQAVLEDLKIFGLLVVGIPIAIIGAGYFGLKRALETTK